MKTNFLFSLDFILILLLLEHISKIERVSITEEEGLKTKQILTKKKVGRPVKYNLEIRKKLAVMKVIYDVSYFIFFLYWVSDKLE